MFKTNSTRGHVARIIVSAVLLGAVLPLRALVPPQYTDNDNYKAKGPVQRIVVKMFDAIDKIDRVDVGDMRENPVIVEYSESGNLSRVVELNKKGDILFYFMTEEKDGKPHTQKRYSDKEWMDAYGTYEYNKGKLQSETVYNAEGELFYTELYAYDKSGRVATVTRRNPRGETLQTTEYTYDAAGNCTRERVQGKENRFIYMKDMEYDAKGNLLSEEFQTQEGIMKSKTDYTYNDKGDIDHVRQGVPGGSVSTIKVVYEYDTHGNWTRCVLYASDYVPTIVVSRQIEYR